VDGSQPARPLPEGLRDGGPYVWTRDNQILLSGDGDILAVDLDEETGVPVADSGAQEWGPHMSPDEKWVAYTSDESGRYEIYVKPYPELSGAWVVSTEGGEEPVWSRDGRSLFYRNGDTWLEVPISYEPEFSVGKPRVAIEGPYISSTNWNGWCRPGRIRYLRNERGLTAIHDPITSSPNTVYAMVNVMGEAW
jgi:hypothetical protein